MTIENNQDRFETLTVNVRLFELLSNNDRDACISVMQSLRCNTLEEIHDYLKQLKDIKESIIIKDLLYRIFKENEKLFSFGKRKFLCNITVLNSNMNSLLDYSKIIVGGYDVI